jgi:hypothetical protein
MQICMTFCCDTQLFQIIHPSFRCTYIYICPCTLSFLMERHDFRRFILRQSAILIDACHYFYLILLFTPPKNSNCRLPLTLSASTTPRHSPPPRRLSSPLPPPSLVSAAASAASLSSPLPPARASKCNLRFSLSQLYSCFSRLTLLQLPPPPLPPRATARRRHYSSYPSRATARHRAPPRAAAAAAEDATQRQTAVKQ